MRPLLVSGGFEIRQWATNVPSVVQHLPTEARSENIELWLQQNNSDPLVPALGLMWHCLEDSLGYRLRALAEHHPTMRYIYKVLATQYDPLGFSIPLTPRANVLGSGLDRGIGMTQIFLQTWRSEMGGRRTS